ncbi:hypothetical protein VTN00DRAFT_5761 [Thermoascus crustaceus]|uniref:uncharacterized protein n=1 Tax=Thermoascus crustaceus TaxID=5088 RepID=UPI0037447F54
MFCDCWPYEVQIAHHPNYFGGWRARPGWKPRRAGGSRRRDPAGIRVPARPFSGAGYSGPQPRPSDRQPALRYGQTHAAQNPAHPCPARVVRRPYENHRRGFLRRPSFYVLRDRTMTVCASIVPPGPPGSSVSKFSLLS